MFALGVEFSLTQLKPIWRVAALGGLAQLVLLIGLTTGVTRLLGLSVGAGILLGCVIALSSTVIVLKVLMERGELDSRHGRISLGLLIVQDLSVVPIMILLPNLADPAKALGLPLAWAILKALVLLALVGGLGTKVFPWVIRRVAATKSKELFLLSTVALCFGMATVTSAFGLSFALGAFVAGIVVSESDHSHQIMADVLPLRDLFATLFFVSIGMLINPGFVVAHLPAVLGMVAAVILGKTLVIFGITRQFGYSGRTSLFVGLGLAQMGEFSFVLAKMGQTNGLLSDEVFSLVLASALLSIVLTPSLLATGPLLLRVANRWAPLRRLLQPSPTTAATAELVGLSDHVVICGFGRVGSNLGEVLIRHGLPVLVIDLDQGILQTLRGRGVTCLFGDASNPEVLRHALLPLAKLMVIALPDPVSCELALEHARLQQPEFEASLEAIRFSLAHLGYPAHEALRYVTDIRRHHYRQFMDDFRPDDVPNPQADESLLADDLVLVMGDRTQIARLEKLLGVAYA